jgi:hypothetical protein
MKVGPGPDWPEWKTFLVDGGFPYRHRDLATAFNFDVTEDRYPADASDSLGYCLDAPDWLPSGACVPRWKVKGVWVPAIQWTRRGSP